MKPWFDVVTPHVDIQKGHLDQAVFAADLSDVVADRGPVEYRDALTFFRKTFPTAGLVHLAAGVLSRLAGRGTGEPVIQIKTPFGGGKTHSLIALYHLIRSGEEHQGSDFVSEVLRHAGLTAIPKGELVVFVGTAADPLGGRTLWGELAWQLGNYSLLEYHDRRRCSPGKDLLHQLIGDKPVLILMDEIVEFAVRAKDYRDQLMAFFQELTETVKVAPRAVLVATLPSSAPYGDEGERVLRQLEQIFGRVETIKNPVEGDEMLEVIRRRLFEPPHDPQEIVNTAQAFFEFYNRLEKDVPAEFRQPAYRERIKKAYPFHPAVIDILFTRWSTYASFQRTRGVLRLLALVVKELYDQRAPWPLILPGHINLGNPAIRAEFLRVIGREYEGIIAADLAGPKAKAPQEDEAIGSEYRIYRLATTVAQAIFFYSFSAGDVRGIDLKELRVATLLPQIPVSLVGDTLKRLENLLWYLNEDNNRFYFSTEPNLIRILQEKEEQVTEDQLVNQVRKNLEELVGNELKVFLWPISSQDVPDLPQLKLAILEIDYPRQAPHTLPFVKELLNKCGQTFRTYRNALLVLVPSQTELEPLRNHARRLLACIAVENDKQIMKSLSEKNREKLKEEKKKAADGLRTQLISAYRYLERAATDETEEIDLGLPDQRHFKSLCSVVIKALEERGLLAKKLTVKRILRTFQQEEQEKPFREVYESFLRYPDQPILPNQEVLWDAVVSGVQRGELGLQVGSRVYFQTPLPQDQIDREEAIILRPEVATKHKESGEPATVLPAGQARTSTENPSEARHEGKQTTTVVHQRAYKRYVVEAQVPPEKLSDFYCGVILPLHRARSSIRLTVAVEAHAEEGIPQQTLDMQVRETLRQIAAQITREEAQ
ncbi:MAG: DUF499 domain-containing protein [Thermoguttaceae bacterium]|nr:DUF499 domain-containing protein [Thermoguttaceae bacterium]MDW8079498.1 DUF499 domain-containing protein [Thermoguttaceae bacterium]